MNYILTFCMLANALAFNLTTHMNVSTTNNLTDTFGDNFTSNFTDDSNTTSNLAYTDIFTCNTSSQCNNGYCSERGPNEYICSCNNNYVHRDGEPCSYKQKSKLGAFLFSLFLGEFGADWFFLARGNGWYIFAGIMKLLSFGGCGVWWMVDWIRVLAGGFDDGNGIEIGGW